MPVATLASVKGVDVGRVAETGAALIMVTHAPEDVRRIADQVVFVADGRAEAPQPAAAPVLVLARDGIGNYCSIL